MSENSEPRDLLRELGVAIRSDRDDPSGEMDPDAVDRITQRLLDAAPQAAPSTLRGRPSHWFARSAVVVAPMLLAAAVLFMVGRKEPEPTELAFEVRSQVAVLRGPSVAAAAVVHAGGDDHDVELVARPLHAGSGPTQAHVFTQMGDEIRPLGLVVESAPTGALRMVVRSGAVRDAEALLVVVGPADSERAMQAARAPSEVGPGFRRYRIAIVP